MSDTLAADVYPYRDAEPTWDGDPVFHRVLQRLADVPSGARVVFHHGDIADLDLSGFDVVTCIEVIEHVANPRPFMKALARMVRPGGRLVMTTPYHGWLKNVGIALTNRHDFHYCCPAEWGHVKFYSHATLSQIISEVGFSDIRISGVGRIPYLWTSMVAAATKA